MAGKEEQAKITEAYGKPLASTLLEIEAKCKHYTAFLLSNFRAKHMVKDSRPLTGTELFDQLVEMIPDIYAWYRGMQSVLQNAPSPFIPAGMSAVPSLRMEYFNDANAAPDFG